ncbi:MAG: GDYXXLXY domain-containing protein [Saprospiraceae bacterium]
MPPFKTIFFGLVMVLYLWVPYAMISHQEKIWTEGEVHRFRLVPIDPYDAFRGNYVALTFGLIQFDKPASEAAYESGQEVYLSIGKDSLGYSYFSGLSLKVPTEENYVTSNIAYSNDTKITVRLPENMHRFYMNETLAPLAETLARRQRRFNRNPDETVIPVFAEVSCLAGEVQIRDMYFGEQPIATYLREQIALEAKE